MFAPGDEVEKFRVVGGCVDHPLCPPVGARGKVVAVVANGRGLHIEGWPHGEKKGHYAANWRKVQKRNDRLTIEAFLTIKPGQFEEPRRTKAPAKKREHS